MTIKRVSRLLSSIAIVVIDDIQTFVIVYIVKDKDKKTLSKFLSI